MQFALKLHTLFDNVMSIILILLMIMLNLNIKENKQCIKKHALLNALLNMIKNYFLAVHIKL